MKSLLKLLKRRLLLVHELLLLKATSWAVKHVLGHTLLLLQLLMLLVLVVLVVLLVLLLLVMLLLLELQLQPLLVLLVLLVMQVPLVLLLLCGAGSQSEVLELLLCKTVLLRHTIRRSHSRTVEMLLELLLELLPLRMGRLRLRGDRRWWD